jgi:2-oxo-4-hydroxy-4-carboxy--5-ureidoimidazoline (OHCU) decarboxylase
MADVAALDTLAADAFIAAAAPWFEGAPRFLARLAAARPFGDEATFLARAEAIALALPEDEQIELIDAHPRLGAPPATVSADSFREQGYDRETTAAIAGLERLNAVYEARHGFRFCIFVNGRSRPELVPVLEAAIGADRAAEIDRALRDVVAIAGDRMRRQSTRSAEPVMSSGEGAR